MSASEKYLAEQQFYLQEANALLVRCGVHFNFEDDKYLGLLLDVAHHLELGRMVILREVQGEIELSAYA